MQVFSFSKFLKQEQPVIRQPPGRLKQMLSGSGSTPSFYVGRLSLQTFFNAMYWLFL